MPNEIPKIPKLTPGEQFWKDYGSQQLNEYRKNLKEAIEDELRECLTAGHEDAYKKVLELIDIIQL